MSWKSETDYFTSPRPDLSRPVPLTPPRPALPCRVPTRPQVPYNGGLGETQLGWLKAELRSAAARGDRVVVLSHAVLHPEACEGTTMVFDYENVLDIFGQYPVVVVVLAGHDHNGGYALDENGCHHITLKSPLVPRPVDAAHRRTPFFTSHLRFCPPQHAYAHARTPTHARHHHPPPLPEQRRRWLLLWRGRIV